MIIKTNTSGKGVLTASILLGIMILPTIINTCESSLKSVAPSYYEGSLALGATKEYSIFKAVFPVRVRTPEVIDLGIIA